MNNPAGQLTRPVPNTDNDYARKGIADFMDAGAVGKWIVLLGFGLVAVGAAVWLLAKAGIPLGRLPGDIHVEGKGSSFHFPIVTCIVVSVVLTVILNVVIRLFGK